MRYFRITSSPFLRHLKPISQNPIFVSQRSENSDLLGFIRSNSGLSPSHAYAKPVWPWKHFSSVREFTSSAQESKPVPSERVSAIVDEISGLTLLEVADLTDVLRNKLGFKEMPIMAMMMPGMGMGSVRGPAKGCAAAKGEEKAAEKTAFDLKLEGFDATAKIKIIKEVRTFTDLGLKEAKDLVEKAPTLLKKGVPKEEAEKIVEKMKEVGAKVTME